MELLDTIPGQESRLLEVSVPARQTCTIIEKSSYFDLSDRLRISNDIELLDASPGRGSPPFEASIPAVQTGASIEESIDFGVLGVLASSNRYGLRGTAPANAGAVVAPSANLPQSIPITISRALKQSDGFYPSPFLSETSPPTAQVSGGFSILEKTGIGIGLLILLCLLTIVLIRFCRKRWIAAPRVSRSLEYSDRESDYSGDERIKEFRVDAGKSIGKSVWSESGSGSESDDPSI
jgi:hypothetical protein